MTKYHKNLQNSLWAKMSLEERLANIGSEVHRAIIWRKKDKTYSQMAIERGLELLYLAIADEKGYPRLKELCRVKECLLDYFFGDNQYQSTDEQWEKYFYQYAYLVQNQKRSA